MESATTPETLKNVAQNPHNCPGDLPLVNSADSADGFRRVRKIIETLRAAGIRLTLTNLGVEYEGPERSFPPGAIEELKRSRDVLIELLSEGEPGNCPWCGPERLLEGESGLWCLRCERLAWVFTDHSIVRADWLGVDIEGVACRDSAVSNGPQGRGTSPTATAPKRRKIASGSLFDASGE